MSISSSSGASAGVDMAIEYKEDAVELIRHILPSVSERPVLHNRIAGLIQSLYDQADEEANYNVSRISFLAYLPTMGATKAEDRDRDAELLDYLILLKFRNLRANNKAKLAVLQRQLHQEAKEMKEDEIIKSKRKHIELKRVIETLLSLIQKCDGERTHVYNLMAVELEAVQKEYNELKVHELQQNGGRPSSPTHVDTSFWGRITQSWSPPTSPKGFGRKNFPQKTQYGQAEAKDRWMDVVFLDEALDSVSEFDKTLRAILVRLKKSCQDEAKELQKQEAQSMMPTAPAMVPTLTMSSQPYFSAGY